MATAGQPSKQMRMVLLGKTGTGKSATGNTILGEKAFESRTSGTSVTSFCRVGSNSEVRVIDTPGFFDNRMSNNNIRKEIIKCIAMSAPGPHAFIVVVRPDRFTQEELDTVKLIKETFGQEVMRYMLVLFVRKDDLDADEITIDDYLKTVPDSLKDVLRECENKYIAFNNRAGESEKKKQTRCLLDLVQSLVERNGGKYYSHEIYRAAEAAMREEQQRREKKIEEDRNREVEKIKKTILEANKSREDEYQKRIADLEKAVNDQKSRIRDNMAADVGGGKLDLFGTIGQFLDKTVQKCTIM